MGLDIPQISERMPQADLQAGDFDFITGEA
jgi:hypothetical protein